MSFCKIKKKRCFAEAIQRLGINSADPDETAHFELLCL